MTTDQVGEVAPATSKARTPSTKLGALLFVWGTWGLMSVLALFLVNQYGTNTPHMDEWDLVSILTGDDAFSIAWLWEQDQEHHIPLPKLLLVVLGKMTGNDFRAGMYFSVLALSGLAFALILGAKGLRGWVDYSDAIFPLLLLHWGHAADLLWSWQVQYTLSLVLIGTVFLIMIRRDRSLTVCPLIVAGACVILLPLTGANGLAYVPAFVLWLVCLGVLTWRTGGLHSRRQAIWLVGLAAVAVVVVCLYFIYFEKPTAEASPPKLGLRASLRTSVQFLSMSFGPVTESLWPFSGYGTIGLLLVSGVALVWTWYERPRTRLTALGLFCFMSGVASLALGLGWGRAGWGSSAGFMPHYTVIAVTAVWGAYFIWLLRDGAISRVVQLCLFVVMCSLFRSNTMNGIAIAKAMSEGQAILQRDAEAGMPPIIIAARHVDNQLPWPLGMREMGRSWIESRLDMLRRARVGPFRHMRENPSFRELPVLLKPIQMQNVRWMGDSLCALGGEAYVDLGLPESQFVYAGRAKYLYGNTSDSADPPRILWRSGDEETFSSCESGPPYLDSIMPTELGSAQARTTTVWINRAINRLRIQMDRPCVLELLEIVLLIPEDSPVHHLRTAVYHPGARIDFGQPSSSAFLRGDWHEREVWGRRSGPEAAVEFRLERVEPLRLRMMANTFGKQRIVVSLNGQNVKTLDRKGEEAEVIEVDLPQEALAESNTLCLRMPDARSPQSAGKSEDSRILGIAVSWMEFAAANERKDDP
jgi:hypothetical protein